MLSHLNILLLSLELIYLLLETFDKVLWDGILGHAALADSHSGVRGTQVQLLENLILGDKRRPTRLICGVIVVTFPIAIKIIKEWLLFLLWFPWFLQDLKTTWESRTVLYTIKLYLEVTLRISGLYWCAECSGRTTSSLVPTLGLCVLGSSGPILIPVSESPISPKRP